MDIKELISKSKAGSTSARKELYFFLAKQVYGMCRRYTHNDDLAKDYMQDSFYRIYANLNKYDPDKGQFLAWVSTLVTNMIFSEKKKKKLVLELDNPAYQYFNVNSNERQDFWDEVAYGVSSEELLAALRQLPEQYRDVVNLHIFEGWRHDEIANLMGFQPATSRSRYGRAKRRLYDILKNNKPLSNEGKVV